MPTRVEAFIDEQIEKLLVPGEAIEAHGFLRSPAALVGALLADHRAELPQATLVRRRDDS